jgi:excinuclease ABC subunit C
MGRQATASMIVFIDGRPEKKSYRKFRIKTVHQVSDFWMMKEVLERRLKHKEWPLPNLFIMDGGKPQVRIIKKVFKELGIAIPLVGIAKSPDRIIISNTTLQTVWFKPNSPFFNCLRYLRDESHRFAKKYHLLLRNKKNDDIMKV